MADQGGRVNAPMVYRRCPECDGPGVFVSNDYSKGVAMYECDECGCLYSTLVARNGLRLDTCVLAGGSRG